MSDESLVVIAAEDQRFVVIEKTTNIVNISSSLVTTLEINTISPPGSLAVFENFNSIIIQKLENPIVISEPSGTTVEIRSPGPQGVVGPGVAPGGVANDILRKVSSANYDTDWTDAPTLDAIQLDITAAETSTEGKIFWDADDGDVAIGLKGNNITLRVGQEQVVRIKNTTGTALIKGQIVAITGAQGQRLTVTLASSASESTSSKTFGIIAENIADQAEGFVATHGLVRGLNTGIYTEGAPIWLGNTPGTFTLTKPQAPFHMVHLGWIARQGFGSSGSIFVHIQNGFELDELHNVKITNVQDKDVLSYNSSTKLWENVAASSLLDGGNF